MKSKYIENGLALLGALVILIGVSSAANTALASNTSTVAIYSSAQK